VFSKENITGKQSESLSQSRYCNDGVHIIMPLDAREGYMNVDI